MIEQRLPACGAAEPIDRAQFPSFNADPSALWNSTILVILAFAAGLIMTTVFGHSNDGDLWWQSWLGKTIVQSHSIPTHLGPETFTAVGAPWVAQEWLFSIALWTASSHGARALFALFVGACALGTLIVVALSSLRRGANTLTTSVALAVALIGIDASLGMRAQVVAWLLMAAFFAALSNPKKRWWCVPITVVWANVHASALLAPPTMALLVIADLFDRRRIDDPCLRLVLLLFATAAAVFATPLGWHLPAYAVGLLASPIKAYIVEWQSPLDSSNGSLWLFLLAVASLLVIGLNLRRLKSSTFERLTLLVYFGLAASAVRHLPVFFIFALPIAAAAAASARPAGTHGAGARRVSSWVPVSLAVLVLLAGMLTASAALSRKVPLPYAAARNIAAHGPTRLYCSNFTWCSMLVGEPGISVYLDGRADAYPPELWLENASLLTAVDVEPVLSRRGVNTVLVGKSEPLVTALASSKKWSLVFKDSNYKVYRRTSRQSAGDGIPRHAANRPRTAPLSRRDDTLSKRRIFAATHQRQSCRPTLAAHRRPSQSGVCCPA